MNVEWDDIKREYLAGIKPKEICEKYNINYNTLSNRIQNAKWKVERDEIQSKIGEKVANIEAVAIQQMREQERKHTDVLVKAILTKLIREGEINPELSSQDVKSLSGAYKDVQLIKYKSFGISDKLDLGIKSEEDIEFKIIKTNADS